MRQATGASAPADEQPPRLASGGSRSTHPVPWRGLAQASSADTTASPAYGASCSLAAASDIRASRSSSATLSDSSRRRYATEARRRLTSIISLVLNFSPWASRRRASFTISFSVTKARVRSCNLSSISSTLQKRSSSHSESELTSSTSEGVAAEAGSSSLTKVCAPVSPLDARRLAIAVSRRNRPSLITPVASANASTLKSCISGVRRSKERSRMRTETFRLRPPALIPTPSTLAGVSESDTRAQPTSLAIGWPRVRQRTDGVTSPIRAHSLPICSAM
eukprot:scaffold203470_cov30-Tisochrysis_lutea.AAC.3